ncbi:MAG: ribose-phosphate pyrophosphokinase [Chloroflexi bacterium]|nr:ribose-phosphate pyrophosphokinase [Chloroflexota bacterium]
MYGDIKLIAGTACPDLADRISNYLSRQYMVPVPLIECGIYKFPNDNIYVKLGESVRGQDVYIIQSMARPVNDNLMELLITLDAVRRDSAGRITAVIPYMSYTRSDKKDEPRTPITARLVADMIQIAGADRYVTLDLHAGQIQGFFSIPGDSLSALHLLKNVVRARDIQNLTVTTVDLGFAKGGRNWSHALGVPLSFIEKKRSGSTARAMALVGDVRGRNVLLVDDEVDTAGSMQNAVRLLDENGAKDIYLAFTHPVFSPPAKERLQEMSSRVKEFIFTDTIPVPEEDLLPNMTVITMADMLGEVIRRAHQGISVGAMFQEDE